MEKNRNFTYKMIDINYLNLIVSDFLVHSSNLLEKLPILAYHKITIEFTNLNDILIEMREFIDTLFGGEITEFCNDDEVMNIFEEFRQSFKSKLADIKNIYIEEDIDMKIPELKEEFNFLIERINYLDFTSKKVVTTNTSKSSNSKKFGLKNRDIKK